jgi:hypothetical protein
MNEGNRGLDDLRVVGRILDDAIAARMGGRTGYALLLQVEGELYYASNGRRSDVVTTLREWIAKTAAPGRPLDRGEAPDDARRRRRLEALCGELGKVIALADVELVLFLFDFGEGQGGESLAWYSNATDPRANVRTWLDQATRATA